ncbi:MAG: hypothetical protein ACJ8CR_23060 [Roseiflexaceae bacterium]
MYGKQRRNTTTVSAVADSYITAHRGEGFYGVGILLEEALLRKHIRMYWQSYKGDYSQ